MSDAWKLTVGLEIHVELETATKMFCGCKNDPFHASPNEHVCPVCYGLPGALPLMNKRAVEMTVQLGRALNGKISEKTFWARKNYFYPDLPKGYQISQSISPLVENATLVIDGTKHRINRIHLEEDAGKLTHGDGKTISLVNYNRAGVPLLEMVTEPDFHSAESAKHFCQELQQVMRHLKISSADMEKGQMRCEANISVSQDETLGTKVEVKNLNSFRSVERAIMYEYERQIAALEDSKKITQETRLWDEQNNRTAPMRSKETSADYRYFPEPDLPAVKINLVNKPDSLLLPDDQRINLRKLGIPEAIAKIVVERQEYDSIMETYTVASGRFKKDDLVKKYTIEDGKLRTGMPKFSKLSAEQRLDLLVARENNGWAKTMVDSVVEDVLTTGKSVSDLAGKTDVDVNGVAAQVIKENDTAVTDYRSGKEAALNFLVGQMMAKTKGRINIATAREALQKLLA